MNGDWKPSRAVWTSLPPGVQAYIAYLEESFAEARAQIAILRSEIDELRQENAELRATLNRHSGNSHQPPSSDSPSTPKRQNQKKEPRERRQHGAQPGHKGVSRELLPLEEVDEVIDLYPGQCPNCTTPLNADLPEIGEPSRKQYWELPEIKPVVTEYRSHSVSCPHCQAKVTAEASPEAPPGQFGPNVAAAVGVLHGRYRLSIRETASVLEGLCGLPISDGSVSNLCHEVEQSLDEPYLEVKEAVEKASVANVDETGWKHQGQQHWLWVAVTAVATFFMVAAKRDSKALAKMVGDAFKGVVGSDRHRAYNSIPVGRRQVCWSHLKRDFVARQERAEPSKEWATKGLRLISRMFKLWHRLKQEKLTRSKFEAVMGRVQTRFRALLEAGMIHEDRAVSGFSAELLGLWPALWTFVTVEGVEPTNNSAERALRPAVLWRKGCFGTQSERGNHFVEKILTVAATCKQTNRQILPFIAEAVRAHWQNQPAPILIATT